MFTTFYIIPVIFCCLIGAGVMTGVGVLFSRRKSKGKGKGSKNMAVEDAKGKGKYKGLEKSAEKAKTKERKVKNKDKGIDKEASPRKIKKEEKKKANEAKKAEDASVSNKKSEGVLVLKNPDLKAGYSSGDECLKMKFGVCIEKYNEAYNGEKESQASIKVSYSDEGFKDDFFVGPESVIRDNMLQTIFDNKIGTDVWPTNIVMNIGGKSYELKFKDDVEAEEFYHRMYIHGKENSAETEERGI